MTKRRTCILLTSALMLSVSPRPALAQVPGPPAVSPKPKPEPAPDPAARQDEPPAKATEPAPEAAKPSTGPSKEVAARIEVAKKRAQEMSKYGDWLSAADELEQAHLLLPDPELAFRVAEAARAAKDCARAERYYNQFLDFADLGLPKSEVAAAKKGLNELTTFDCPARNDADSAALAKTFARRAEALAKDQDWLGASLEYVHAYAADPTRPELAFEIGVTAWKAHECGDAVSYFYHFREVADPRKHRSELERAGRYIDDSEAGKCEAWTSEAAGEAARQLYAEGQTLEFALDYAAAAEKYQRALLLVPENVALNYSVAEMLWAARRCAEAEPHYRAFVENATDSRLQRKLDKSRDIIARIDAHHCPDALWAGGGAATGAGQSDPNRRYPTDEGPPPVGGTKSGGCAVVAASEWPLGSGWGSTAIFALLGLVGLRRRSSRA